MLPPQPEDAEATHVRSSAARCSCTTASLSTPGGGITVLRVAGELDLATLPVLDAALARVLDQRPRDLIVDLAGVSFCCVSGLGHLRRARNDAEASHVHYALSGITPSTRRVLTMLWPVTDLPPVHPTAAVAVLAAMARQADQPDRTHPAPRTHHPPAGPTEPTGSPA